MASFTPLRVRSHGSLLHGLASPEALIARALENGFDALALTDRDNLYLAVRFMLAARAEGLRPLLGAEITHPTLDHSGADALLIPSDRRGYARLCALISRRHLDPAFDLAAVLSEGSSGLHVVVESPGLAAALLAAGVPPAEAVAGPLAGGVGPASNARGQAGLWIGIRGLAGEGARLTSRIDAARMLGVPLVATGDVAMLAAADHEAHRAAVTAARGELIDRMPAAAFAARDAWFATPAEWTRRVRAACGRAGRIEAADEALIHNAALVDHCHLELGTGTPIFPRAPRESAVGPHVDAGMSGDARLRVLATAGLAGRYAHASDEHRRRAVARLDEELAVIANIGFTDYFLLVAEIVGFARAHGIPTVGRGSGASSIVAYVLGITNVDPIRYGLYFERFLNPSRRDCPDLDIDLCWKRRDEVIAHVYRAYGDDRVAMISTHATLGARSAFRETAKVLGVPNARVNVLARRIPHDLEPPYLQRLRGLPSARGIDWSEPVLQRALSLAERLDGSPRHLSVHSGGLVIADRELTHYVPLERAAKDVIVTQFEMRAIEAIGLVKMDLLGNRALTEIGECIALVSARAAPGDAPIELDRIPEDDPRTGARVASGDTLNCFQLESPAMRHLLRMANTRTLSETAVAVALVRPGPASTVEANLSEGRDRNTKETFCRRQRGLEPASFLHPKIEPVLREAHGLMLYEEDVMCVASAIAGLTLAQGDDLRRAIAHAKTDEEFRSLEQGFIAHAARSGVDRDTAHRVWCELTRFAAYAFCKAHAAGYGTLGWHTAYLKSRFPAEWAVAVLNHHAGMYPTWVHVEDLRRHGVEFRAPCTMRSGWDTRPEAGAVRVGLSRVFGLSVAAGERVLAARSSRAFSSLADFIDRARPSIDEIESLILAGALDWTRRSRPSLLLEARTGAGSKPRSAPAPVLMAPSGGAVMPDAIAPIATPEIEEFDSADRVRGELNATGLWFSAHPLDVLIDGEARRGSVPIRSLTDAAADGKGTAERVTLVGLRCAGRRLETKRGEIMLFSTLADHSGLAECMLMPDVYRALADVMQGSILRVEGRLDRRLDTVTVIIERAIALDATALDGAPSEGHGRNAARR
jgi:DNA-directed DNA polymerase III PolC